PARRRTAPRPSPRRTRPAAAGCGWPGATTGRRGRRLPADPRNARRPVPRAPPSRRARPVRRATGIPCPWGRWRTSSSCQCPQQDAELRGDRVHAGQQAMIVVQQQQRKPATRGEILHAFHRTQLVAPAVDQQRGHVGPQLQRLRATGDRRRRGEQEQRRHRHFQRGQCGGERAHAGTHQHWRRLAGGDDLAQLRHARRDRRGVTVAVVRAEIRPLRAPAQRLGPVGQRADLGGARTGIRTVRKNDLAAHGGLRYRLQDAHDNWPPCETWPMPTLAILDQPLPYAAKLPERPAAAVTLVVIHCTELPDLATAREYGEKVLYDSGAGNSGHYYVDRDGAVYRYV